MPSPATPLFDAKYVLREVIGVGGMGQVYAAEDAANGHAVAIKVVHQKLIGDPNFAARLADEARALECVEHHNVVRVIDHGVTPGGLPYLVMPRVNGTPLGAMIETSGPLPFRRIRAIASQLLHGLGAIHRAGLVHGDIKSDNVLVESRRGADQVTIIDFGLAHSATTPVGLGSRGTLSGTPEYMAPEVIRGEPATIAADLYAVGVVVYEMLTGTTPFTDTTPDAVFARQLGDEVVPPSLRCQDREVPPAFEHVIMRALAKNPAARHANAEMFATAIERSLQGPFRERHTIAVGRTTSQDRATYEWPRPTHATPARLAEGTGSLRKVT
jgi:serine/threonine-protein kinase